MLDFGDNHTPPKKNTPEIVAKEALFCAFQGLLGLRASRVHVLHHLGWLKYCNYPETDPFNWFAPEIFCIKSATQKHTFKNQKILVWVLYFSGIYSV